MSRRALLLLALALSACAVAATPAQASHTALQIASNADFAAKGWTGDGTLANPYRPPAGSTSIVAAHGYGIEISNTNVSVNISSITVAGGSSHSDGIRLYNVRNVVVYGVTLETNRIGIHVRDSTDVMLAGNTVKTSSTGVSLEGSRNVTLRDNRIQLNDNDVSFRLSTRNMLVNNNLSVATGQFGLFFADNTSYDNSIDASNLVNGMPLRWYTNLAGAPGAPIVIADVTADLPRMTNVAQVMVSNSSHVRLERVTAKAGAAAGIHVHASRNVELATPIADGNAGNGIFLELSNASRITNASARNNGDNGFAFQSTHDVLLATSAAANNGNAGVRLHLGTNATTMQGMTLNANTGGGVVTDTARNVTVETSAFTSNGIDLVSTRDVAIRNNTIAGSGSTALRIAASIGRYENNTISGHATAVSLASATGNNLTDNTIALANGGTGIFFDGPASYDNAISTTNTVNGTRVRWYTNVVGPVTLPALRVEQRGITNVAQIMLFRSSNVTLTSPVASQGAGAGIIIHESPDANVSGATAASNAAQGILGTSSRGLRILGSTVTASGADGIKLTSSHAAFLENDLVQASAGRGIVVEGSDMPTFRGNAITGNAGTGLFLNAIGPGGAAADHNTLLSNAGGGIIATSSTVGSLFANTLTSNGADGISLSGVPVGARLDANVIANHTRNVRLAGAEGTTLTANAITMSPGQTGFHLDDEASYNISLIPTNTVNGIAVRWYVGTTNVTITDARVELAGITNVAQVMLYRVANVTLTGAVATNGSQHGIYVRSSQDTTVLAARAENNTRAGITVENGRDIRVEGATSRLNVQEGFAGRSTAGFWLLNSTFERNGLAGVSLSDSPGAAARIENLTVRANQRGVQVSGSNVSRIHANVVSANGPAGLSLSTSTVGLVTSNTFDDHVNHIELSGTTETTFLGNVVTKLANQTGWSFASPASYRNHVGPTNTVNGVPMRWYAGNASLTLTGVRVELPGMTNVAQVMAYEVSALTIEDMLASNGTARGLYVVSANVARVNASAFEGNAADGFEVTALNLTLIGSLSRANGGDGLQTSVGALVVRNSTLRANAGEGVRASAGIGTFDNVTASSNAGNGLLLDGGAHVVLSTTAENNTGVGVLARSVGPFNLSRSTLRANAGGGATMDHVASPTLYDNTLADNAGHGIHVASATGASRVSGNRIANSTRAIQLSGTEFAELHANVITAGAGQVGLHFSDEPSYNNVVPTSNTVNGQPVHWYTTLAGSEGDPVVLSGVRSEQRGITNVAQVMVYRSAYVRLPGVVATNGTARGVYVHRSSSITIEDANVSNNTQYGIQLQSTQSATLRGILAQGSGTGVHLVDSSNNLVTRVNASGATVGVVLSDAGSRDNRVDQVETNGTARGVTDAAWSGNAPTGNNLLLDAGAPKRGKIGASVSFGDTTATYRLEASRILTQTMSFGDGTPDATSSAPTLLRPSHAYATSGTYRVNLTATTADGLVLSDSVAVEIVPPLSAPRSLIAIPGARNSTLTWSAPEFDGASTITKYRIYRGTNSSDVPFLTDLGGTSFGFLDTNLENGRTYTYQVSAVNADGEGPKALTVATPVSPPGAPATLTATAAPNATTLNWSAPSDLGGLPLGGYYVLRAVNNSSLGTVATVGNVSGHTITGLTNGVTYTFAVRAFNLAGAGTISTNVTATPVGPPGPGRDVRALPGDAAVTLVWSAPSDDGGTAVTGYRVWRGAANGSLTQLPSILAANASSFRDTGLSNGQRYLYGVSAINAYGEGDRSASVAAVPQAIDALKPIVFEKSPSDGVLLGASPETIRAQYADNDGIALDSILVWLDDALVAVNATETGFVHVVAAPLARGEHSVRIVLRDPTGNEANETWSFRILSEAERVPRFEITDVSLVPDHATPGANVTARASVHNVGYAAGNLTVTVMFLGNALAYAEVALAEGEAQDLFLEFQAPTVPGSYEILVADQALSLVVQEEGASTEAGNETMTEEPASEEPPVNETPGPKRPVRTTPPPRATPTKETPFPGVALVVLLGALAACQRRKA